MKNTAISLAMAILGAGAVSIAAMDKEGWGWMLICIVVLAGCLEDKEVG